MPQNTPLTELASWMRRTRRRTAWGRFFLLLALPACVAGVAYPVEPLPLIRSARRSIETAWAAKADIYAAKDFLRSVDTFNEALEVSADQQRAYPWFRDYTNASSLLALAGDLARRSVALAWTMEQRANVDVMRIHHKTRDALHELALGLQEAYSTRSVIRDFQALRQESAAIEERWSWLSSLLDANDPLWLQDQLESVKWDAVYVTRLIDSDRREARVRRRDEVFQPKGIHIVIDRTFNRLYLKEGKDILLDAPCSTGSGQRLSVPGRSWRFETPRGRFRILSKVKDPVWRKPDWAFIEDEKPIPSNEHERYEKGVLGEYALGFTRDHFIHGTLYERLLGESVTHGCVRLGSDDLRFLSHRVSIGTPVYIE